MRWHGRFGSWGIALPMFAFAVASAAIAAGQALDPARPWAMIVAEPEGPALRDRVDPRRAGLSQVPLPVAPSELWRRELPGGLDFMPIVTADGTITAALANRTVIQLDPAGEERWRMGAMAEDLAAPLALAPDGSIVLLGTEGRLMWVGPGRTSRQGEPLRARTRRAEAAPLVMDDGSVFLAAESELVLVSSDRRVVARASVDGLAVGGLLRWHGQVIATLDSGAVVAWRPPAQPRQLGMLAARPLGGGVLAGARTLVAVAPASSVVALDLRTGETKLLAGGPGGSRQFEGPPTLLSTGELAVATVVGELLLLDARGRLVSQFVLDNASLLAQPDAGSSIFGRLDLTPSPPLLADVGGRMAFVRATGRLGVISPAPESVVTIAATRFCGRALGVAPAGPGRLLVACRNGSLGLFADEH